MPLRACLTGSSTRKGTGVSEKILARLSSFLEMEPKEILTLDLSEVRERCRDEFKASSDKMEVYASSKWNMIRNYLFQKDRDWSFLDALGDTSKWRVLDYGAGVGYWSVYLEWQTLSVVEVAGLPYDFHRDLWKSDRHKVSAYTPKEFQRYLFVDLKPFDLAIFTDVIEHLSNPMEVLDTITRCIAPKGLMIFYFAMSLHDAGHLIETIDNAPECWRYIWDRFDLVRKLDHGRYCLLRKKEEAACQES